MMNHQQIVDLLGNDAESLLSHECTTISKSQLHIPSPDFINKIFVQSNRNPQVLRSLGQLFNHGRLSGTGYTSILPIDQGIEFLLLLKLIITNYLLTQTKRKKFYLER